MHCESLAELTVALREFAEERDWNQFHSPKNLAAALIVEAAEALEHFQWLSDAESKSLPEVVRGKVELELADVLIYLVRLADRLDVDLLAAASRKLEINATKYPIEQSRGNREKYTELQP